MQLSSRWPGKFRRSGTVDTAFRNGGHGVPERWTRCAATVDTVFCNGRHGVPER
ncbi:hypothetical protein [Kibdelosporangium philippinense]|uniref:hypothetical protein n=1 Tax=Kibdelosporangium philippinense TaxID=211113 RepID=UPI0036114FF5